MKFIKKILIISESRFRKMFPNFHPTRWRFFRLFFLKIVNIIRPRVMRICHGFNMDIPKDDFSFYTYFMWRFNEYEPESSKYVKSILRPNDIVLDIGANIGYYSCLYSKCVGSAGTVYSFEPEPINFERLVNNLKINNFYWAVPINKAVADESGSAKMYLSEENYGDHTLIEIEGRKSVEIEVLTIDSFIASEKIEKQVRLVKIDVQGFEHKVFIGMKNMLRNKRIDKIIFEFTPYRVYENGDNPYILCKLINNSLYDVSVLSSTFSSGYLTFDEICNNLDSLKKDKFATFDILLS